MRSVLISGDPSKEGPYVIRAKMPAGYRIPAHWHPTDENVTVVSGTVGMGLGDTLDPAKGHSLSAGDFMLVPAQAHHFLWSKTPSIIQVHGMGPFAMTYVNPSDDPRNAAKPK